jgi:phosphate transport system permease protein
MRLLLRSTLNKIFTLIAGTAVVILSLVLLLVLGPMIWKGSSAVVFRGTVEFRKMQMGLFQRGHSHRLEQEIARTQAVRQVVYDMVDAFQRGIDIDALSKEAGRIHRQFGQELRERGLPREEYSRLRALSRDLRDKCRQAFASRDRSEIVSLLDAVLEHEQDPRLKHTAAEAFFPLARGFKESSESMDLDRYHEYAASLHEVTDILTQLLGPQPGDPIPLLVRMRYGATRWDQAQALLHRLLWVEQWVETEPGRPLVRRETPRVDQFAGTRLEGLFAYVRDNLPAMLKPRLTIYWQFFIDDSFNSHYFGGVGPEILGTLVITVLGMIFVVPLGVISAAYLVECAGDNWAVRTIRLCINTLAGVPSIVFGLFGLAFFVLFLFPFLGMESKPCILAASLTLAVLTLPVMIRASEEAIRAVPQSYKEGSLALGASRFRTFMTVILPAALPGILTGVILSLSRIAGETAPILFTGAVALGPVPKSILDPTRTLSYGSYDMAVGDRVAMMVPHNQYGMVVTLVLLILCLNGAAIVLRGRVFKKLKGH